MGTNENSKNIYVSHGITPKERKLERMLEKKDKKMKKKREWIRLMTTKPKRVNKNGKINQKFWVD